MQKPVHSPRFRALLYEFGFCVMKLGMKSEAVLLRNLLNGPPGVSLTLKLASIKAPRACLCFVFKGKGESDTSKFYNQDLLPRFL